MSFNFFFKFQFLPLCIHPDPKNVLIVGGGDGGVAREVQKFHKVQTIHQVEIDDRVVELSKKFLPKMARGFDSPKVNLFIGDGFEFMKNHKGEFDVIITDSSDPVGPAESLFQESYFALLKQALRPDGIICSQGGTYWVSLKVVFSLPSLRFYSQQSFQAELPRVKQTLEHCRTIFPTVRYASAHVPSYPCGQIGFVIGSLENEIDLSVPRHVLTNQEIDAMELRYYTPRTHRAAFDLPRYFEREIASIVG